MTLAPHEPGRVGITYHPLLHGVILASAAAFDSLEVPLGFYANEAQRGLLDPDLARLRAAASGRRLQWQATIGADDLSLAPAGGAVVPASLRSVFGPAPLVVPLRPLGADDRGVALERMVRDIGLRCDALRARSTQDVVLEFALDELAGIAPGAVRSWLAALAASTSSAFGLVLRQGGVPAGALAGLLGSLPPGRLHHVAIATADPGTEPVLDAVLAATGARLVLIRRLRHLHPIGDLLEAAARARAALARAPAPPATAVDLDPSLAVAPVSGDPSLGAEARVVWQARLTDMHRARELGRWRARTHAEA